MTQSNDWVVRFRIPCDSLDQLQVKGSAPWRGGLLKTKKVSDVRGDYYSVTWVDRHGDVKRVPGQIKAMILSHQAGRFLTEQILLKANPTYNI